VLSLQNWSDGRFATSSALLAVQSTANNASSTAALALNAANGNEAYAALTVDAGNRLTAMRINGVTRAIEFLSESVSFLSPAGGERTEYRAGNWHVYNPADATRTRYGKAFGGAQKLVWWTGPDTIAEGSESKANAYVYVSQNSVGGLRFGGSDTPSGGGVFTGWVTGAAFRASPTTGSVTTSTVTAEWAGATGTVSVEWIQVTFNFSGWTITSPNGPVTAFRNTVATAETKTDRFGAIIRDGGSGRTLGMIVVPATVLHNI